MADTYRHPRDPYMHGYNYHHQYQPNHQLPMTPDYLGTPPTQSAALANYSPYTAPPSPHHPLASPTEYWNSYSYGQFPPTPTSPYSAYSPSTSQFPAYPSSPSVGSSRGSIPEVPDFFSSREVRPSSLGRPSFDLRQQPTTKVRRRRASNNAVADLQIVRLMDLPEDDRCCNICMEPYVEERFPCEQPKRENAKKMPCGHVFGAYCLKQWLKSHNSCPACRMEVDYVEVEEEEPVPRSRTQRRQSMSTHELIVNDLFGEPYRDPTPIVRPRTPNQPSRSRSYYENYDLEPRPGTTAPACQGSSRPSLRRSHTSMGQGGPARYPFARPPSEDYSGYTPPSPQRVHGKRDQPFARPGSSASSGAVTTHSEPSRGSDGYYTQPGLPSMRQSRSRKERCAFKSVGLCSMEEEYKVQYKLIRLDCGHAFHTDCLSSSLKVHGDSGDLSAPTLWCERCRKYTSRRYD